MPRGADFSDPHSILITGASSGIGAALALHYAAPGITLFLSGRNAARLESVADGARGRGASVFVRLVDVCDRAAMREWIESADAIAALDLVIANAGISGGTGGHDGETEAQTREIFAVNLDGVLNTLWPTLDRMRARSKSTQNKRRGQVALVASIAGFTGWPGAPAYSAVKGAVRLYGEALHGALAAEGIGVSVVCPGFIRTPMTDVNDYPMPFLMEADQGAAIIARRLARGQGRIAFPFATYGIACAVAALPHGVSTRILSRLPKKPAKH